MNTHFQQISHGATYDKGLIRDRLGNPRTHVIVDDDPSPVKHSSTRVKPRPLKPADPVLLPKKKGKDKIEKVYAAFSAPNHLSLIRQYPFPLVASATHQNRR